MRPSAFRKGLMACTGIEFCKLALAETKGRAIWLARELEERLPDFDEDVRIHVNGCPNSCARFQVADIGLMGAVQPRPDGTKSESFLVHLGGGLGENGSFGAKAKGDPRVRGGLGRLRRDAAAALPPPEERARELHGVRAIAVGRELAEFARWDR